MDHLRPGVQDRPGIQEQTVYQRIQNNHQRQQQVIFPHFGAVQQIADDVRAQCGNHGNHRTIQHGDDHHAQKCERDADVRADGNGDGAQDDGQRHEQRCNGDGPHLFQFTCGISE